MHGTKQLSLLEPEHEPTSRRIVYQPPDLAAINEYALNVCQKLIEHHGTPPLHPDTRRGFAAFVNAVANMIAKQKTRESEKSQNSKGA